MYNNKLLHIAIEASIKAGKAIMEIYDSNDFGIEFKGDKSPLTKADLAADKIIQKKLLKTDIPILSEEGKDIPYTIRKNWDYLWIVDPIDGTKEFINKNGEFTVNIALIKSQKTILGVVYAPAINQLYFSSEENGSFKANNVSHLTLDEIYRSAKSLPIKWKKNKYTVVASRSHMSSETETYISNLRKEHGEVELLSKGSSLKIVMVAEGIADCYPRFAPTMEWDTAAGQAICEHAGFNVIDWDTKETMKYNRKELLNNWFLVKKN